ncbi:MAG TPA: hypothetical protein VGE66_15595 [Chitinophagaceae bacterium]
MKKVILFLLFIVGFSVSYAQQGGDPAVMLQRMKERQRPELVEKARITEAEADKVIEISFESRQELRGLRELGEEDRKKKLDEVNAGLAKKFKAIPLTDEQVKSVQAYFEERRKQMQQRRNNQQ